MSKRYGRNQKRKAREKIARLERDREIAKRSSSHFAAKLAKTDQDLRDLVREIDAVCPYSALLPPKQVPWDVVYGIEFDRRDPVEFKNLEDEPYKISDYERVRVHLSMVKAHVRSNREAFEKVIHLKCGGRGMSYRVSTQALRHARDLEHVYKGIHDQLMRAMVEDLTKVRA